MESKPPNPSIPARVTEYPLIALSKLTLSNDITYTYISQKLGVSAKWVEHYLNGRQAIPEGRKKRLAKIMLEAFASIPALLDAIREYVDTQPIAESLKAGSPLATRKKREKIARDNGKPPNETPL